MKRIVLLLSALTLGACTINGVTLDPSRSTTAIAPDYLQLTPDEQNIWSGLSDAERKRAIPFITNGGTLVSSLGAQ
ncbi:MAG: hypothetical protein L3J37_12090 [Rhodobacteraceae bacterium]|nr:hypothetical protein [Paracoccaceae bacterium]